MIMFCSYCTDKCPAGYYGSKKDSTCHSCDQSCYMCYGPSYNNCLECNSKYFLLNTTCEKSCPEGYFSCKFFKGLYFLRMYRMLNFNSVVRIL